MAAGEDGLYLGLISGTSADGIDVAAVDLRGARVELVAGRTYPWDAPLRAQILRVSQHEPLLSLDAFGELDTAVADAFAGAALQLIEDFALDRAAVRAIGSHGQTLRHRPRGERPFTLQVGDPSRIAERSGCTVVADFRRRDVAAGGQGAPLVPAFHAAVFGADQARAIVNIGGIANITCLPAGGQGTVMGFDCGPGNMLLDLWAQRHLDRPYDADGRFAASGRVSETLLQALRAEPFFALAPPKSTGRDLFNAAWLDKKLAAHAPLPAADVQATLTALTAETIAAAIADHATDATEVIICGGGARNATLMSMLGRLCAPRALRSSADIGVPPEHVEALAFAWLACAHVEGRSANLPEVTGARGARLLGALYPR